MIATFAHKITAFALVFVLFAHNINTIIIMGDFLANQAFIAKNLCIQKENQQGCNGKCQLTKQIEQSTPDSNSDLPVQEIRRMSLDAFCLFDIEVSETPNTILVNVQNNSFGYTQRIIHRYQNVDTPPPNFS